MSHRSYVSSSSSYSSDQNTLDGFSTTSSQWTTTYKKLPKKQSFAIQFLSWAAGAPPRATVVKKKTRDIADDRSLRSGGSSRSYFSEPDTQLYWVTAPEVYHGGSSSGSRRGGKSRRNRFPGQNMPAPPPMHDPMMDGGFNGPPPPMMGDGMGGHMGGGGFPPPPPPQMNGPPGGAPPAFFDVTGQRQPGNPFNGPPPPMGPPAGGFRPPMGPPGVGMEDEYSDDE
ncbi:Fc.00g061490.m01.CDS01 [Cosmosporella sp. VM-42]